MKALIVTPCGLPIPAVKGGAVLTLLESIIKINEIEKKAELTVVGVYDEEAITASEQYPGTRFVFIRYGKPVLFFDELYEKVFDMLKKHHKIAKRYLSKLQVIHDVKKLLWQEDFDRVVFQNAGYLLNVLKDKKIRCKYEGKLYYHIHNDIPSNIYAEGVRDCRLLLISRYLEKRVIKICGSIDTEKIIVVKNGIDTEKFGQELSDDEAIEIKNKLHIPLDNKVVLFTGRIDQTKGISETVDAVEKLHRNDITLLVVGSNEFGSKRTSPFEIRMKNTFAAMGERVVFTGYVPYENIWKYYKIADVAVLPSMWEEPAGLTMIEACASDVPLITTLSGGIPEYISSEWANLLPKDSHIVDNISSAIEDVFSNYEIWKDRAKKAQDHIKANYDLKNFYNAFFAALNR